MARGRLAAHSYAPFRLIPPPPVRLHAGDPGQRQPSQALQTPTWPSRYHAPGRQASETRIRPRLRLGVASPTCATAASPFSSFCVPASYGWPRRPNTTHRSAVGLIQDRANATAAEKSLDTDQGRACSHPDRQACSVQAKRTPSGVSRPTSTMLIRRHDSSPR